MNRATEKHIVKRGAKTDFQPQCLEHYDLSDAFYITSCLASFLQLASCGIMDTISKGGTPARLDDAKYGMEYCFTLLQDMLEIAEKESMPAEVENA